MRYTVFGATEFGPTRLGALLGVLLADAGQVVTAEELVERVLGDAPPPRARAMVQTWLTRLRQTLPGLIERDRGGYVLRVDPLEIDLHLFRHLVRVGRTADALALAQAEPLSTLDTPWARQLRAGFAEELLAARLDHVDERLARGERAELVPELHALASSRPLDERIAAQLIEALHGSGRAAEALRHFEVVRARLAGELGAEPSRHLATLHRRLRAASAPRQLPAAPKPFTGRALELAELDDAPNGVVVITGTGGVGKTSLAVHWAHQAIDRFPDGQLYVNLHGFGPSGAAVSPGDALLRFLSALDVPRAQVPHDLAGQSALLRDALADKRVLVLLDNATDAEQVEPLLPRTPNAHVVITSRTSLKPPHAKALPLGLLPPEDARELLAARIGHDRARAEPDAVDTVVRRCARLPLALAVAGARAATQPEFPLAALADELADLDAFADDDDVTADLRSVFSHSCKALSPAALRLFRLLGLMPGSDISLAGAASLAALDVRETEALLAELATANLIDQPEPGRFTCHDLLRDYAAELALDDERDEALNRLLDHLALTGVEAGVVYTPSRHRPATPPPAPGVVVLRFGTHEAALAWLMAEHPTLMAAMRHGTPAQTWLMGWSLADALDRQARYRDLLTSQQLAVAAVEQLDDADGLGRTLINLGRSLSRMRRPDEATAALHRAFDVYEGNPAGQAGVLLNIAMLCPDDRIGEAMEHTRRGLALFEECGDSYGQANALTGLAWGHGKLGEYAEAVDHAERAMRMWREMDHLIGQAEAWDNLGTGHLGLGDHAKAAEAFTRSSEMFRLGGDLPLEAGAYEQLGDTHAAAGAAELAREAWQKAVELRTQAGLPTDEVRAKLQAEGQ
ncbi:BTAD domain-containing putative transcriptional regulator [Lentzea sp. BCCO 10_0798]|uniref:BTAD domain-containing putative transcriptional regulator n=1 Tax=Lentzea kristufekii TaxID=3095430 RepID=A0ABU4U1M3_9PSEU|nr:BTAD domain-containing putative transcriptional regulator [Lentzea sp. BCCO 10_0798]MDX8054458.1 BTAD domain-containing putative transcriptional regulator [Lentzea sp. BCCO 10_0798]